MKKLFYLTIGLLSLLYASQAFCAAFTSVMTGNWNDGATWGNDSPGVKGTDWPGAAADTSTITATHLVTYNVSEANALGNCTVAGTLYFSRGMDTQLTLGSNNYITISAGGWLDIGAAGDEIPAAYTATLLFNRASAYGNVIVVSAGGKFTAQGDSAYYGSDGVTYLANNAENTDGDASIITTEDQSAKWAAGQVLYVQFKKTYVDSTPYNSVFGTATFTIDSLSGTTIASTGTTITADAGVGDTWTAAVFNLSRNVVIREDGTAETVGTHSTLGGVILDNNVTTQNVLLEDVEMIAVQYTNLNSSTAIGAVFTNCTNRNTQYPLYNYFWNTTWSGSAAIIASAYFGVYPTAGAQTGITIGGYILATQYPLYGLTSVGFGGNVFSASVIGALTAFTAVSNGTITSDTVACCYNVTGTMINTTYNGVDFWGNNAVLSSNYDGFLKVLNSNFYENSSTLIAGDDGVKFELYNVKLGWDDANNSRPNTGADDFTVGNVAAEYYFYNVKLESGEVMFNFPALGTVGEQMYRVYSEHHNQVLNAHFTQTEMLNLEKVACDGTGDRPTQDPNAGNGYALEIRDVQANLDQDCSVLVLRQRFWKTAGEHTVTYKVQTTYSSLPAYALEMKCYYLTTLSSGIVGLATDASAITTRSGTTDWTQTRTCTFTHAEEGWITVEMWFSFYEASDEVWIWPEPTWS